MGRGVELDAIRAALARARDGASEAIVISGEAGIWKSRLVEEAVESASAAGALAVIGRCSDDDRAPPYEPFAEIVAAVAAQAARSGVLHDLLQPFMRDVQRIAPAISRHYPALPAAADIPAAQEFRFLGERLIDLFRAVAQYSPLVAVVEDAHWADDETLGLLRLVASRIDTCPRVVLLLTHRDSDIAHPGSFARVLEQVVRSRHSSHIELRRLDEHEVAEMVTTMLGPRTHAEVISKVVNTSDGNPFFVEEVARHLSETRASDPVTSGRPREDAWDLPRSIQVVVDRRLSRLPDGANMVLESGAVVGREFDAAVVATCLEMSRDDVVAAVRPAVSGGLVVSLEGERDTFRFNHELTRQVVLRRIDPAHRRRLHLAVARALKGGSEPPPLEVAYHYNRAGDVADAADVVRALLEAGTRAIDAASFGEGERLLRRALELLPQDEAERRAICNAGLGRAARSKGDLAAALPLWASAAEGFVTVGRGVDAGVIYTEMALELSWAMRGIEAMQAIYAGLAAFGDEITRESLSLRAYYALMLSFGGQYDAAEAAIVESRALQAEHFPALAPLEDSLRAVHAYNYNQLHECADRAARGIPALEEAGELWALTNMLTFVQDALCHLMRFDECRALGDRTLMWAEKLGHSGAIKWTLDITDAVDFTLSGDLGRLEHRLKARRMTHDPEAEQSPSVGFTWLSITRFLGGFDDEAVALAARGVELDMLGVLGGISVGWQGLLLANLGNADAARSVISSNWSEVPRLGEHSGFGAWQMTAFFAEALLVLGDHEQAASLYPILVEMIERGCLTRDFDGRLIVTLAGLTAWIGGDAAAAEKHLSRARSLVEEHGMPFERAEIARLSAMVIPEHADRKEVEAARQWYEVAGMHGHVARTDVLLGRISDAGRSTEGGTLQLQREGDYWTVSLGGRVTRVRDMKGLRYLEKLVSSPGRDWHVLDLVNAVEGNAPQEAVDEGGLEVLDDVAKQAYRRRISELEADIEEARADNDLGRVDKAQAELDALIGHLKGAVGLGGRTRTSGSTVERARVNITKVLRATARRIETHDPLIGTHLESSLTTGTTCSYRPR